MPTNLPILRLKRNEDRRISAGHLWVFSNEVDVEASPLTAFAPGDLGELRSDRDKFLGVVYVNPKTLPAGPFLAYDHSGKLVSTIYMIPLKDMDSQKKFDDLAAPGGKVDHVSLYHNAGHPGVPDPHYHVVLWHVAKAQESLVAK